MITHVAIKDESGNVYSLPKPNRHGHIFIANKGKGIHWDVQGFLNDKGEFVNRKEAFLEALENNQVLPPRDSKNSSIIRWDLGVDKTPRELYSEDLW